MDNEFFLQQAEKLKKLYVFFKRRGDGVDTSEFDIYAKLEEILEIYTSTREKTEWNKFEDCIYPILNESEYKAIRKIELDRLLSEDDFNDKDSIEYFARLANEP